MKKILMIIAPKDFQDMEYQIPKKIFEEAGFEVVTASTKKRCLGVFGLDIRADILISEAVVEEYKAVALIGGGGAQVFINDPEIHGLLNKFYETGKIVTAICLSPATLAQAGVLKGKKATVFPDPRLIALLQQNGAEYTKEPVEQDGRIITATDPTAAKEFAETIVEAITKTQTLDK